MANASEFLIAANDEHGLNPPTAGKRTPIMPYINRSFYENEFNKLAKLAVLMCIMLNPKCKIFLFLVGLLERLGHEQHWL